MNAPRLFLLLTGVLLVSANAQAQLCKWTDENGTVHYDTECPEEVEAKDVDVSDALSTSGDDPYASSRQAAGKSRNQSSSRSTGGNKSSGPGLTCEQAREKRLKPERDRLIAQCKSKGDMDAAQCQRYYATYGDGRVQGSKRYPPKYMNIPECQGN